MGVEVTTRVTADGKRLEKMLKELSNLEVAVGFQRGKAYEEDGTDVCDVALWNELGTEHSPSRPFLRKSVDENQEKISEFTSQKAAELIAGKPVAQVLNEIGVFQKGLIQEKITNGEFVPNTESTIKKKGSDKPLIDTGRMRQSVNYVIRSRGGDDD